MKVLKNLLSVKLLLLVFFASVLSSCGGGGGDTPKTLLEILSKNWKISRVRINGTEDNVGNYGAFRILLQQNSTYAVTPSASPLYIIINPANNGRWEISSNETSITFDKGTSNEFIITLLSKTEISFSVKFKVPKSINKTEPEYIVDFVLVP